ncbi:gephyrin-like molybdotransferase Glp [Phycicoccus sp.]|uniref:molybdopterin molybdotransferase MoeA n=1 Tax=Phycicoccus sp. TaxID=1902410 RepID=UPI002B8D0EF2|nr:gephyrin-like molybdotransferase Glp [Phycicoccus sp.]HMM94992.1 molybdopterin molybdotransferase MoeA [Phycicoccus sp.]
MPEAALDRVLSRLTPLSPVDLPIDEALDHVLAEALDAATPVPLFDNAAMDGYALRAADVHPGRRLRVVGEVRAGQVAQDPVGEGRAVRVMTGAPIPPGADAVVPWERTRTPASGDRPVDHLADELPAWVVVDGDVDPGRHVRRAGEDLEPGDPVAAAGVLVGPAEVALACAGGHHTLRVVPTPVVAVLSTGDEVAGRGERLAGPRVPDVDGPALAALARRHGATVLRVGPVPDEPDALAAALDELAGRADLVVTSGGASGGAADLVARLGRSGHPVEALSLAMKPGKPLCLGWLDIAPGPGGGRVPFIGLPGNPVAAMVAFEVFAGPVIARLRGLGGSSRVLEAVATEPLPGAEGKVSYVRVRLERRPDGTLAAGPTGGDRPHGPRSLVATDGLAVVDSAGGVAAGEPVLVRVTGWSGTSRAAGGGGLGGS